MNGTNPQRSLPSRVLVSDLRELTKSDYGRSGGELPHLSALGQVLRQALRSNQLALVVNSMEQTPLAMRLAIRPLPRGETGNLPETSVESLVDEVFALAKHGAARARPQTPGWRRVQVYPGRAVEATTDSKSIAQLEHALSLNAKGVVKIQEMRFHPTPGQGVDPYGRRVREHGAGMER